MSAYVYYRLRNGRLVTPYGSLVTTVTRIFGTITEAQIWVRDNLNGTVVDKPTYLENVPNWHGD